MLNSTITKTAFFATTPATVWAYLTEAKKLGEWFHPADANLAANSEYALLADGNKIIWGKVQIWDKPKTLQYTFEIAPFGGISTIVTWNLEEAHGGTMLSLTHEGVGELGNAALGLLMALEEGWDEHIASLRKLLKNKDHAIPDCSNE